ncbi:hypothetical protein BJ085DRAFT_21418 [Dimargaris cristalligena]|uniref:RBR-type E3 ubiquitin transferase n=1 Tax=Dimargaris cristalligena TaxID=215637 RepID=A0A4P9ZM47_9FUNG|nr:hypothetical protein BJ085DRAFT_21418 [Dimargaris cristalligena]|eukprot:RKP34384.1 hypothetical protein BJ085DRAFT_21418 [Dimargaris cristalligena]
MENPGLFTAIHRPGDKSPSQVDFVVRTPADLVRIQRQEAAEICNVFGMSMAHATMMLRTMRWNREKLIERYIDDAERVLRDAGIADIETDAARPTVLPLRHQLCEICFSNEPNVPMYALACDHAFCVECYNEYLSHKIQDEGLSARIQCPGTRCPNVVDEPSVEMLAHPVDYVKFQRLLLRSFVDENQVMKWCPAPGCEYAVECHTPQSALDSTVPTVKCRCGHEFCFGCGYANHQPCICNLTQLWLRKCMDDSETSTWISVNTKECSRCRSIIEKNGGCNHMTCRKCSYEFCWVCMGPWAEHGRTWYHCNRYGEQSSQAARDSQEKSRSSLKRYLHYYNRYANHEQSARLDHQLYLKTEKRMESMQQKSDLSWIEVQFLRDAVDTLVECRMTLKWTYALAFYLEPGNLTTLFEDNQCDLEMATEQLSGLLERPLERKSIPALRQQILDKTAYVASRRQILLDDTAEGLADGRWRFNMSLIN